MKRKRRHLKKKKCTHIWVTEAQVVPLIEMAIERNISFSGMVEEMGLTLHLAKPTYKKKLHKELRKIRRQILTHNINN